MSSIQVADETFVAASAERVARVVADRSRWRHWWPDLRLEVTQDRGAHGIRWRVEGSLSGTMEVWLQTRLDGVVLHYFVHAEPVTASPGRSRARAAQIATMNHERRVAGRRMSRDVKHRLESGRAIGDPAVDHPWERADAAR